jgi:hypothetical protein
MKPLRFMFGLLLGLGLAQGVQAHRFAPSLLDVQEIAPLQYNVVWKTPAQGVSNVPLRPVLPESCAAKNQSEPQLEDTGVVTSWQLQCVSLGEGGLVGQTIGVAGLAANQASAMAMVSLLDGRRYQQVLTTESPDFVVPLKSSAGDVASNYTWIGMEHIWGGVDHLLFVFGLLLLVGGGMRLLWTITAFTVGHSITLSLVTLGYFSYPVALVEFAIALSIFILAVELTRTEKHDALWRNPWWLAGGFGLLHGMGFAGALAETGLPQDNVPLALLFFNVGIELGQLVFILVALALWYLVRKPLLRWKEQLLPVPIYILGVLSALWCIQRGLAALHS